MLAFLYILDSAKLRQVNNVLEPTQNLAAKTDRADPTATSGVPWPT